LSKEATVSDPRGLKRICTNCGTRFFDLNKRPIVCPQCDTEFTGEVKIKNRRGRLAADDTTEDDQISEAKESDDEDLIEDEVAEADTVSLEEVEEIDGDDDDDEKLDSDDIDSDLDDDLDADLDDLDDDEDLDVDLEEEDK
jgi:uncharacterized protein (TIGR02300 family)